jgi:signal transduction histidine kinase
MRMLSVPRVVSRMIPNRLRLRLTLLYGALFVICGAVLLAITYLLVSRSATYKFQTVNRRVGGPNSGQTVYEGNRPPDPLDPAAELLRQQADRQRDAELHNLLVNSSIALAIMALLSIAVGWLVAGRILRRLRVTIHTIKQISAQNVHERLAAPGPPDEMKELSDTVDGLLERLETALAAHKRFVANAAHELRTPLTLERALLEETLMDNQADLTTFRSMFERILVICQQQGSLLESLLTLASSERGLDRKEPVDLAQTAEHVLMLHRPRAEAQGLRIQSGIAPARTVGDPALVERLVANLIDNAIAYNVPGGHLAVRTGVDGGRAVVHVENSGPPVSDDLVDGLFAPFERLDRSSARDGHHGLGLSIVQAIATVHEATIVARARPDGGLAVTVAFPVTGAAGAANEPGVPQEALAT